MSVPDKILAYEEQITQLETRIQELEDDRGNEPYGVLPMTFDDGTRLEAASVSGGSDSVLGMPRLLILEKTCPDGASICAHYVIDAKTIVGQIRPSAPPIRQEGP